VICKTTYFVIFCSMFTMKNCWKLVYAEMGSTVHPVLLHLALSTMARTWFSCNVWSSYSVLTNHLHLDDWVPSAHHAVTLPGLQLWSVQCCTWSLLMFCSQQSMHLYLMRSAKASTNIQATWHNAIKGGSQKIWYVQTAQVSLKTQNVGWWSGSNGRVSA
jgi:hypothetical protein